MGVEVKKSICWWCRGWCHVYVNVEDGKLIKVEENPEFPRPPFPPVRACSKARAAKEWFYHPDRLNYPLKRVGERGEGKWKQISWEQALDEIAEKLAKIREQYGAEAVATSVGTARTHDEFRCRFFNLFGSPNEIGQATICYGPRSIMCETIFGWFPCHSVNAKTRCVVLLGLMPEVSRKAVYKLMRDGMKAGSKLIVIDPRRTRSASEADVWLQLRPGTDCALLMAMVNIIIKEKLYDDEFVNKWCYGFDQLKERAEEYGVEKVAEITGVPAEKIKQAAIMYATNKPGCFMESMGVEQLQQQSQILHARCILAAITGNLNVDGGEQFRGPDPRFRDDREMELIEKLSPEQRRKRIGEDRFKLLGWQGQELVDEAVTKAWGIHGNGQFLQCQAHGPSVYRAMLTGKPYPVRAMITLSSNPLVTQANTKLVYKALKSLDLYVVDDFWMTPSAEIADYVLPAASWLERPSHWTRHGCEHFLLVGDRAVPPVVPGQYDRRDDYEFWRGLAIRLGQEEYWPWKTLEEVYDYRLEPIGYTHHEFVDKKGWLFYPEEDKKYEKIGFGTHTGKVELYSTILEKLGYDPLPRFEEPKETPISDPELAKDYPLMLITGWRHDPFFHSEHRQIDSLRKMHPNPLVQVHPETARRLDISDGDWVWIETPRGRIRQKCQYFDGIDPGVIAAQHGWWFPELPGEEPWLHGVWESNVNVLTNDDPDYCNQVIGGWPLRTALCKIYKVKKY